jgi:hypothetical protein
LKLQQFYILSLESKRIKKENNKIKIGINEARLNQELISVADSQLLRTLRQVVNKPFHHNELSGLWAKRIREKKKKNNVESIGAIRGLSDKIDNILFVPELISAKINHKSHYKNMLKNGFKVNGIKFVRFMGSSGQLRRSVVLFIKEDLLEPVRTILENGINKDISVNFGKFNAYYALSSSSSFPVSTPRYIVIPDKEVIHNRKINFVEDDNKTVSIKNMDITHNLFDGQGLVSIDFSEKWSEELELGYNAVSFIFRASWMKGLLVAFDFRSLARELGVKEIIDIYGDSHQVEEIDVILTQSQFKLYSAYSSIEEHRKNSEQNNLFWGITRTNPKTEKKVFWSSYQYLQVLGNEVDVRNLCQPTIDYIYDVSSGDADKALIYLMGDRVSEDIKFNRIDNSLVKILSLEKEAINDPYIKKSVIKSLNRKIKDSYTGKLLINGNYQFILYDCYALAQWAFGIEPTGLLKENEHFSSYWNKEDCSEVISGRSPLTWVSELNKIKLVNNRNIDRWFGHLYSGIIFDIYSTDMLLYGDSDGDGDLIFTSDNQEMINNCLGGLPVSYEKHSAKKDILDYKQIPFSDLDSFESKIGLITNASTTYYSMLSLFDKNSKEYELIRNRIIICRKLQGNEIDKTKGLIVEKPPEWSKWISGNDLHNSILTDKRPFWMRYLYPHKMKEWTTYHRNYNLYCYAKWNMPIDDLMATVCLSKEQEKIVIKFEKFSPLILGSTSMMERISRYMIEHIDEIKSNVKMNGFDYSIYRDNNISYDKKLIEPMKKIIKKYNKLKKDMFFSGEYENISQIIEVIKGDVFSISCDLEELTNLALDLCYGGKMNQEFVHHIFEDGILYNLKKRSEVATVPVLDKDGDIKLANRKYTMVEIET